MNFQKVCDMHGGKTERSLQAAKRREIAAFVTERYPADPGAVLAHEGVEPIQDPVIELSKLAQSAKALMAALAQRVNALEEFEATWQDKHGVEQIAGQITLYGQAMDRTARLLKMLIDSGFEQRRVELDEKVAAQFSAVLRIVFEQLNLTIEQRQAAPAIVVQALKAIESGGAA